MTYIVMSITGCARCQGDGHKELKFWPLTHPIRTPGSSIVYTHYSSCPKNAEPILLTYVKMDDLSELVKEAIDGISFDLGVEL